VAQSAERSRDIDISFLCESRGARKNDQGDGESRGSSSRFSRATKECSVDIVRME
jgi:hypothetical protein